MKRERKSDPPLRYYLREKLIRKFSNDMQGNDRKDKAKSHDHNDNRINPQTRGLVCVKLEHCVGWTTSTGRTGWVGTVGRRGRSLSFLVGLSANGWLGTTGNSRLKKKLSVSWDRIIKWPFVRPHQSIKPTKVTD